VEEGRAGRRNDPAEGLAAGALLLALCTWIGLRHPGSAEVAVLGLAAAGGALLGGARARARRTAVLLALCTLACWRGAALAKAEPDSAACADSSAPPREGRWQAWAGSAEAVRGELVAASARMPCVLPAPLLADGELVRLHGGLELERPAVGPTAPMGGRAPPRARLHPDQIERPSPAPTRAWTGVMARLRRHLSRRLDGIEDQRARALARAMLVGDASEVDGELNDLFRRTGVAHVLSISGMHVWLVWAVFLAPLCTRLACAVAHGPRARARLAALCVAGCMALYVPLAGAAPPVRRAALAIGLYALARALPLGLSAALPQDRAHVGRGASGLRLWAIAMGAEVLLDPRGAVGLSAQLSYAAALGLATSIGTMERLLDRLLPARAQGALDAGALRVTAPGFLETVQRAACILTARVGRIVRLGLAASMAAAVASLPLSWLHFGEWSPIGMVLTPLLSPLVLLWIGAAWARAALDWPAIDVLLEQSTRACTALAEAFDRLPWTPVPLPQRPAAALTALAVLTAIALVRERARSRTARVLMLANGLLLMPWRARPCGLELALLDVGHGLCLLARAPGLDALVFDCGSRDRFGVATLAAGPQLASWEVSRPWIVLSHADRDHSGGLEWLRQRYPPALLLGERLPAAGPGRRQTRALGALAPERLAHTPESSVGTAAVGIDLDRGVARLDGAGPLEVFLGRGVGPESGLSVNEQSRSLVLVGPQGKVVLWGDCEAEGLRELLEEPAFKGPCALVLAPHHGSDSPWTADWLDRLRPDLVWISAGSPSDLEAELSRRGQAFEATHLHGPLEWPAGR
jgi:competence protein ComEC